MRMCEGHWETTQNAHPKDATRATTDLQDGVNRLVDANEKAPTKVAKKTTETIVTDFCHPHRRILNFRLPPYPLDTRMTDERKEKEFQKKTKIRNASCLIIV